MANYSTSEEEIRELAHQAASSSSTNPWGPLSHKLGEQLKGKSARAIGIQDSTVVDRAIGSPGMLKPLDVHGFVVKNPPERHPAELTTVIAKLEQHIITAPYISTAVVFPYTNDFYPSHILSSVTAIGASLAELYPNAQADLSLKKEAADATTVLPQGPWRVLASEITRTATGSVYASLNNPEGEGRYLTPGDAVVLVEPDGQQRTVGVGRLHHVRPTDSETLLLVFDRYMQTAMSGTDKITRSDGS